MKTLTHFLDTPKRSEISALLKPLPISSTTCDSRGLNNISRSSLKALRLLRFLFIVRKSILPETVSNMKYWETTADKLRGCRLELAIAARSQRDGWRWVHLESLNAVGVGEEQKFPIAADFHDPAVHRRGGGKVESWNLPFD